MIDLATFLVMLDFPAFLFDFQREDIVEISRPCYFC